MQIMNRVTKVAKENGWRVSRVSPVSGRQKERFEKDGYELYQFNDRIGFELTIRDPETTERETVLEVTNEVHNSSPLYWATMMHVLENAEGIVAANT